MQSKNYDKVKYYYQVTKSWTLNMVRNAVIKEWITVEEYVEITGLEY